MTPNGHGRAAGTGRSPPGHLSFLPPPKNAWQGAGAPLSIRTGGPVPLCEATLTLRRGDPKHGPPPHRPRSCGTVEAGADPTGAGQGGAGGRGGRVPPAALRDHLLVEGQRLHLLRRQAHAPLPSPAPLATGDFRPRGTAMPCVMRLGRPSGSQRGDIHSLTHSLAHPPTRRTKTATCSSFDTHPPPRVRGGGPRGSSATPSPHPAEGSNGGPLPEDV